MKKFFALPLLILAFTTSNLLYCPEGEVKTELKEPGEYKDPSNEQGAREAWNEAEKESGAAETTRTESVKEWKDALKDMNKSEPGSTEWNDARARYDRELQRWGDAGRIRDAWEARKTELSGNEIVKQYKQDLEAQYTPPTEPTFEEPSWWKTVTNRVTAWFKERQVDFYSWLGNKDKVVEIRQDLAQVYADLGKGGALDKARNTKELSSAFDELSGKIGKGLEALIEYKDALDKGAVTEKEKATIKAEIRELGIDLITLREQLETEGVDKQIRDTIDAEIDTTLDAFGIGKEIRQQLEKQAGVAPAEGPPPPTRPIEIARLAREIRDQLIEPQKWKDTITKDTKNYADNVDFKTFVVNLDKLSRVDFSRLNQEDRLQYSKDVWEGYKQLHDTLTAQIFDITIPAEDRMVTLVRSNELFSKVDEAEEAFNTEYEAFMEQVAREATQEEMTNEEDEIQKPLPDGYADRFSRFFDRSNVVDKVLARVITEDPQGMEEEYTRKFDASMQAWTEAIEKAAVSQESINVREKILKVYNDLLRQINDFSRDHDISSPELGRVLVDIIVKINKISSGLEFDREMLTIIKQEVDKLKAEPVKEHARLKEDTVDKKRDAIIDRLDAEKQQFKENWDKLSPEEKKQLFLMELKTARLKKTDPVERASSADELVDALTAKVKAERGELPPELEAKLRGATTETQLKNAVAEITYQSARDALKPTKIKEAKAPKEWWDQYVATGVESGGQVGVPG